MPRQRLAFLLLVILLSFSRAVAGAEKFLPWLDPAEPPLALVRLPSLEVVGALLSSSPAGVLGVAGRDWSVRPPGLPRIPRVKAFLSALSDRGGSEFWFCLAAINRSALGWRWRLPGVAKEEARARALDFLKEQGLDVGRSHLVVEETDGGGMLVTLAATAETLDDLRNGRAKTGGREWNGAFAAFVSADTDGVGLWLDPRPFSGFAAIAAGVDIRSSLAAWGAELPSALSLWLSPRDAQVGLKIRIDGLFRAGALTEAISPQLPLEAAYARAPNIRIDADLSGVWEALTRRPLPAPPGADYRRLFPSRFTFGLWTGSAADASWVLAGGLGRDRGATETFLRLGEWLELLASGNDAGVAVRAIRDSESRSVIRIDAAGRRLLAMVEKTGDGRENIFLTNGDLGDLPRITPAALDNPGRAVSAFWDIRLDAAARNDIIAALPTLGRLPLPLEAASLQSLFSGEEKGRIVFDKGVLTLESPRGALLWLVPAAVGMAKSLDKEFTPGMSELAAARLRYLLGALQQLRFRGRGEDILSPAPLADSLSDLNLADPDGDAWLDNALPPFPGLGRPNRNALARVVEGKELDGYTYQLRRDGGWYIVARPARATLPTLRIGFDGALSEMPPGGEWRPRKNSLNDWFADRLR